MVNIQRLKDTMQERHITVEQAAQILNIHPTTFYRRINKDGARFTVTEVGKLADLLSLDDEALRGIFFEKETA